MKIIIVGLIIIAVGYILCAEVSPSEYHPVVLQGKDCTMKIVKDPTLMKKLRYQEAIYYDIPY